MTNSHDNEDGPGEPPCHWQDWFRQFTAAAKGPTDAATGLDTAWRAAVDGWWEANAAGTPMQGRALIEPAVDQGKAFIALASGVGQEPLADAGADVLWRQPLLLWERAATNMLALPPTDERGTESRSEALIRYRQTLLEYAGALREVSARALSDVADSWDKRRSSAHPPAGLRELFDLYVDIGEQRYHELVSSEAFAEMGGRLINNLVACVHDGAAHIGAPGTGKPAQTASGAHAEQVGAGDFPSLLADLGFGLEQTLAELRAFGEKLDVGVETLRGIGDIHVGASEKEAVHRDGKLTLYRYLPSREISNAIPVLIVYALANRPYMLDLQPQRSLIRGLMSMGLEIYLIDWGYPDGDDIKLGLDDYVDGFVDACVDRLRERHGLDRINLLGVCQGGTFSLCYGALHPDKIRNLVLMVTPVDFHTPDNLLTAWLRHVDVDRLVDVLGNVPGELLNWAFVSMKPLRLTGQKYLDMLNFLGDAEKTKTFLRMEKWIHDSPAQAGECFRQFAKDCYQQNKLVEGGMQIGGRDVDLQRITMPVLNVYATQDHIVPPSASLALERLIASSDYTSFGFEGGHIGIYVSARAQRQVPQKIAQWLQTRCDIEAETSL
jgi:polyhydroxyalkanoate synthase